MKNRWLMLGVGLLAVMALFTILGPQTGPGLRARFPSSHASEPEGLLAFRLLLAELGIPNEAVERPWDELVEPVDQEPTGVIVLATPLRRAPDRIEVDELTKWLERGGALLVFDDASISEATPTLELILDRAGLAARLPTVDLNTQTLRPARPQRVQAWGTPALPAAAPLTISANDDAALTHASAVPLAISASGSVVAGEGQLDAGRVVRVLGGLVANDRLLDENNLDLALNLVEELRDGGNVWFDEFHHGFGGAMPVRRLDGRVLVFALAQFALATLLFGFARGLRFGPIRAEPEAQRRSSLEYVHSMASLYRRANARRHLIGEALQRFTREARAQSSLAESTPLEQIAAMVAAQRNLPHAHVADVLQSAHQAATAKTELNQATMLKHARALAQLEQEAFGEFGPST